MTRVRAVTSHARAKAAGIAALGGYDYQLHAQAGGCAICGRPPKTRRLHIDHDHARADEPGVPARGLLCALHNRGLAFFADDPVLLETAAVYLRHGWRAACDYRAAKRMTA